MTFQVPVSKASFEQNQFKFELPVPDGKGKLRNKVFTLPKMQYISSDIRARLQQSSVEIKRCIDANEEPGLDVQLEAASIQRELFEKYAPNLYSYVTDDQIRAIQEAWQEASAVNLGESSPSAD